MEMFRNCGWMAFVAVGISGLATFFAIAALALAFMKPRGGMLVGALAMVISLGAPGAGVAGMVMGQKQTDAILASGVVGPEHHEKLRTAGYEEAGQCVPVGIGAGALPLFLAAMAVVIGLGRRGK